MRAVTSLSILVAALVLTGCAPGGGPTAVPSVPPDAAGITGLFKSAAPSTGNPAADNNGLVPAEYPQCDVGAKILNYLATGNNGGDPMLDQLFASDVGTSQPQARALADQYITKCDAQYAQQAAAAASSAAQAQQAADVAAQKQTACAAIGGKVTEYNCASTVQGNPSGQAGADCSFAYVWFTDDGHIDQGDYQSEMQSFPGCFR